MLKMPRPNKLLRKPTRRSTKSNLHSVASNSTPKNLSEGVVRHENRREDHEELSTEDTGDAQVDESGD